jgi:hypothetical protein
MKSLLLNFALLLTLLVTGNLKLVSLAMKGERERLPLAKECGMIVCTRKLNMQMSKTKNDFLIIHVSKLPIH